jgi:integrase
MVTVIRTKDKSVTGPDLDIAQWALEDPGRWGPWVAPNPVKADELENRKVQRRRKAREDGRPHPRAPAGPADPRPHGRPASQGRCRGTGSRPTCRPRRGVHRCRSATRTRRGSARNGRQDLGRGPHTGKRRDLGLEDERAFWTWAVVEVLRATGIRIEELLELSHHSLVQYRLPSTGELVPLLQIVPSKTDTERLLLVSPELADVLSAIICRARDTAGAVPLVRSYDRRECAWQEPAPLLFQRRIRGEDCAFTDETVRTMLHQALTDTGLSDATDAPLRYTPHDFRRLFITDAILNGLPPHIAQVIAGHQDINVTLGYKAVYPEERRAIVNSCGSLG